MTLLVPGLRADFTEGAGDPPRVCRDGKRKLTESAMEFPKASAGQTSEGSLREVRERVSPGTSAIFKNKSPLIFRPAGFVITRQRYILQQKFSDLVIW